MNPNTQLPPDLQRLIEIRDQTHESATVALASNTFPHGTCVALMKLNQVKKGRFLQLAGNKLEFSANSGIARRRFKAKSLIYFSLRRVYEESCGGTMK